MTVDEFLINFGHVAMAPSGVKRLRELVLHLAVSGRLVPRESNEGEGEASIAEAATLNAAYRAKHQLRSSGSDRPLGETELAFEIPAHWKWERLGNIACYIQRGKSPKYDDAGKTHVVSQKCIQWSGFDLSVARRISDDSAKDYSRERFLESGDILWNSTGTGTAGRLVVYPRAKDQVVTDSHVTLIRLTNFVPTYVWCYLASPTIQQRMIPGQESSMVTGTTNQVELSATKVFELPIPCPPLVEQKRIVAKVDELMALCDQLEAQQQVRERSFPVLSRTCHARFVEAPTPANLNRIFDETGNVTTGDLRRTILTLGVNGHLVSSAMHVEPELVGDHVEFVNGYAFKSEWFKPSGVKVCRNVNVAHGILDWRVPAHVSEEIAKEFERFTLQEGDIVLSLDRPIITTGLKVARIRRQDLPCLLLQRVAKPVPKNDRVELDYFYLWLQSPAFIDSIDPGRSNGVPHISTRQVQKLSFRLPARSEQRRIVAKVDELMALVEQLEAQQQELDRLAEAFAKACVASFTGATQLDRPEKMKAPKTELVSIVAVGKKPKPEAKAPLAHLLRKNKGTLSAKSLWQQSDLTIDAFYQQLKTELAQGWIIPPAEAEMKILDEA